MPAALLSRRNKGEPLTRKGLRTYVRKAVEASGIGLSLRPAAFLSSLLICEPIDRPVSLMSLLFQAAFEIGTGSDPVAFHFEAVRRERRNALFEVFYQQARYAGCTYAEQLLIVNDADGQPWIYLTTPLTV